jgi:hypothetical protein
MTIATHDVQDKVSAFLIEQLAEKEIRTCNVIELTHTPPGMRPEVLKEWRRADEASAPYFHPDSKERVAYLEQLAIDVVTIAEERADIYRGADNVFKLRTVQLGGGHRGYPFRILPSAEIDGGGGMAGIAGDMPASPTGVLAMQMRNNEFHMRMNKEMQAGTIGVLTTIADDLRKENKELREERKRLVDEINANRAQEAERELAVVRQAGQESRKDLIVGKAVALLPVVASRLLPAAGGLGDGGEAVKALLSELGSSMQPNQIAMLASVLTTEQRITFGELMKIARGAPDARDIKKPEPAAEKPNPVNGTPTKTA